jgi:hypothetical protein
MKYVVAGFAGFYIGTLLFYYNWKINVIERKWVQDYGDEYPYYTFFKLNIWMQYVRAYNIHFYRYKLFYFLDE